MNINGFDNRCILQRLYIFGGGGGGGLQFTILFAENSSYVNI